LIGFLSKTLEAKRKLNNKMIDLLPVIDTSVDFDYDADYKKTLVDNKSKGVLVESNAHEHVAIKKVDEEKMVNATNTEVEGAISEDVEVAIRRILLDSINSEAQFIKKLESVLSHLKVLKSIHKEEYVGNTGCLVLETDHDATENELAPIAGGLVLETDHDATENELAPIAGGLVLENNHDATENELAPIAGVLVLENDHNATENELAPIAGGLVLENDHNATENELAPIAGGLVLETDHDATENELAPIAGGLVLETDHNATENELAPIAGGLVYEIDHDATGTELQLITGSLVLETDHDATGTELAPIAGELELGSKAAATATELPPDRWSPLFAIKPDATSIELATSTIGLSVGTMEEDGAIELEPDDGELDAGKCLLALEQNTCNNDSNSETESLKNEEEAIVNDVITVAGSLRSNINQSEIALFIKSFVSEVNQNSNLSNLGLDKGNTKQDAKVISEENILLNDLNGGVKELSRRSVVQLKDVRIKEDGILLGFEKNERFNTSDIEGNVEYIQVDEFDISTTNSKCRLYDNNKSDHSTESSLKTKVVRAGRISNEHLSWIDLQNELHVEVITAHQNCILQHIKILQSNIWITETRIDQLSCMNFIRRSRLKRKLRFHQENLLAAEMIAEKLSLEY